MELPVFRAPTAYVYAVPPARTAAGHRADDWDVNKWLAKVSLLLATLSEADDDPDAETAALIRLLEPGGDVFAECPLPPELPLAAAVEPVVDSSRYFVLRVADRQTGRSAVLGLGFDNRDAASEFRAALAELGAGRERAKEARRRRSERAATVLGQALGGVSLGAASEQKKSLALGEGQKITISVPSLQRKKAAGAGLLSPPPQRAAGPLLPPPPPPPPPLAQPAFAPVPSEGDDPFGEHFGDFVS